jgi:hypothetical protein
MSAPTLTILHRAEEESWSAFSRRIREADGELIVILTSSDNSFLQQDSERKLFLAECAKQKERLTLATKEPVVLDSARRQGIRVIDRTRGLRKVLTGHPKAAQSLRTFSPSLWRQQWRSRLQSIGLLSMPKLRIWLLIGLSVLLFLFVVFRLLPSADVKVWPRRDVITHTMNITLVVSGATVHLPDRIKTLPLYPLTVTVRRTVNFTQVSPEFIGTDAEVPMTIYNKTPEEITLRAGTRLQNQAGMVFRLREGATVPANGKTVGRARADHMDIYGKIIGDRGNVPAGLAWTLPALDKTQQKLITAVNAVPGTGGRTAYRKVLQKKDLDLAVKQLRQELEQAADQLLKERQNQLDAEHPGADLQFLNKKDTLIRKTYTGFVVPMDLVGQAVDAVPVQGTFTYTVPAYDSDAVLRTFGEDVRQHVGEGKKLVEDSISLDPQQVIIIEWADNFSWIKITADIVGTEEYVLDPLTPAGARFGKKVRDAVSGLSRQDALRIVRNFPEVEKAEVSLWPPWGGRLPSIPANIAVRSQK